MVQSWVLEIFSGCLLSSDDLVSSHCFQYHLHAGNSQIYISSPDVYFELQTSSSLLDKSSWVNHTYCKLKIPKLNSHSSSKPAFLTVSSISINRTPSFLFLRLDTLESFFFFHLYLTFMKQQIILTSPAESIPKPTTLHHHLNANHIFPDLDYCNGS